MAIEPVAAASPRLVLPLDVVTTVAATAGGPERAADPPPPRIAAPPARRVEVTFHDDLRALMTRVLDGQTGELLSEYPARQVLDTVADLIRTVRAREEV